MTVWIIDFQVFALYCMIYRIYTFYHIIISSVFVPYLKQNNLEKKNNIDVFILYIAQKLFIACVWCSTGGIQIKTQCGTAAMI